VHLVGFTTEMNVYIYIHINLYF